MNSGVSVSDEDVKKYQKKIKDSLELGSNSVFAEFVKGFGGEKIIGIYPKIIMKKH